MLLMFIKNLTAHCWKKIKADVTIHHIPSVERLLKSCTFI